MDIFLVELYRIYKNKKKIIYLLITLTKSEGVKKYIWLFLKILTEKDLIQIEKYSQCE